MKTLKSEDLAKVNGGILDPVAIDDYKCAYCNSKIEFIKRHPSNNGVIYQCTNDKCKAMFYRLNGNYYKYQE